MSFKVGGKPFGCWRERLFCFLSKLSEDNSSRLFKHASHPKHTDSAALATRI